MKLEELEKQLKITVDTEEIKKLHYRYINALMVNKWDDVVDCFAKNCDVDLGGKEDKIITGKAEISKLFRERVCKAHTGREGLIIVHPIIEVDGDHATGKWVSYFLHLRSGGQDPMLHWMMGVYDCKYIRENNKWKFSLFKWRPRLKYASSQMQFIECDLI